MYPEYKNSGVPWLGDIPAHWGFKQIRFVMTCNDDVLSEDTNENATIEYIEISDVDEFKGITGTEVLKFSEAPSRARRLVKNGDILVSTVRTYLRAIAPVKNPSENMVVSTGFAVLRPEEIDTGYSKYAMLYDGFIGEVISRSKGISYPAINSTELVRIEIPVPPSDEQKAIAAYLDTETARIDTLVKEKEGLIELLKEWRQSVIAEAVTKGLNKSALMKQSGVPWLKGEFVPSSWVVKKIKHICDGIRSGDGITSEDIEAYGDYPVYGGNGLRGYTKTKTHSGEYVLIGRQGALCGNIHYVNEDFFATEHAVVVDLTNDVYPKWASYIFEYMNLGQYSLAAAQPGLSVEQITMLELPVPSKDEQISISNYLDSELDKIRNLLAHTTEEVALLKELRAATIADAVLGRVKVF